LCSASLPRAAHLKATACNATKAKKKSRIEDENTSTGEEVQRTSFISELRKTKTSITGKQGDALKLLNDEHTYMSQTTFKRRRFF
jgi:hypothetical protein